MRKPVPFYLAMALLLLAGGVDFWGWWSKTGAKMVADWLAPPVAQSADTTPAVRVLRPKISIAVDASYPPFASVAPDGSLLGFEVELAGELGRRVAERVDIVNMDTGDASFDALASKRIDAVVAGLTYYPELPRTVAFSDGYFDAGPVMLTRADRPDLAGSRDLAGRTVAVEFGSMGDEEAQKLQRTTPGMRLLPMDDINQILGALTRGVVDVAVLDRPAIPYGTPATAGVRIVWPPLRSMPYMVVVRRQDRALLQAINADLKEMRAEGVLDAMEKRWFVLGVGG